MSVFSVPRNNLEAARQWYEAHKPIRPEEYQVLRRSQDDETEFDEMTEGWEISPPPQSALEAFLGFAAKLE